MVEKGLGRESDEVIAGIEAKGLKRFIVQIATYKIILSHKFMKKYSVNTVMVFVQTEVVMMQSDKHWNT